MADEDKRGLGSKSRLGDGIFRPPLTPRMVERGDSDEDIHPVSEDSVLEETDGIFRSFVQNMQANELQMEEAEETPTFNELAFGGDSNGPFSPYQEVGRRLATIGDSINARYTPEFNNMIKILNPTPDTISEIFLTVGDRLFADNQIHWGRIITLLCFGYRLAVTVLKKGIRGFFVNIITYLIDYLMRKKIVKWIADRGGWRAVLNLVPETVGWTSIGIVVSVAVVSLSAAVYFSGKK